MFPLPGDYILEHNSQCKMAYLVISVVAVISPEPESQSELDLATKLPPVGLGGSLFGKCV